MSSTLLIANNCTRESGSFMGDQLCSLKAAYLFVANQSDVDRVIMSVSPGNEMAFLWDRFIRDPRGDGSVPPVELVRDEWNAGDWASRWAAWDRWRGERVIEGRKFDHYRELYLRIHGAQRQTLICGSERGLGRRNIYEYWLAGQENAPDTFPGSDVYDVEIDHPPLTKERDVYISPHCKTQGNHTFTFQFWADVVARLLDAGVTVTVGYDGHFCDHLAGNPLFRKHWGDHRQWMEQVCGHKLVACGNTGTGWLAAACGVPMVTMEPIGSVMSDHRYRECGLRNLVEVVDTPDPDRVARRIIEEVQNKVVMTTGCYDVLHVGHVRHLERSRALGTKLVVALNSDHSVRLLKGTSRPINPQQQRRAVLEALRCVDEVVVTDDPLEEVRRVRPTVLTNGFGYTLDTMVGRELVESWGGRGVITCQGDATNEPSTTKIARRVRTASVMEVCRHAALYSVCTFDKLKLLADEFLSVLDLPGDVADLGAYMGGASLVLRRLAPEKDLHIFDTWAGTPYDDDLCHHKQGEWVASLEDCRKLVGTSNLTSYCPGVFPHSVSQYLFEECKFAFVYVDMDTYQSTKDAINFFWPRMVPGGKLLFDDYGWEPCAGVKKAVDEMFPPEECDRYKDMPGVARRRVVGSLYACVVVKP